MIHLNQWLSIMMGRYMEWDMILTDGINYVDILRKPIKNPYDEVFTYFNSSYSLLLMR